MQREDWDQRYGASELVWPAGPNVFLVAEAADLPPGRALDVACGEGRNATWLAQRGWEVVGADYSPAALRKAEAVSASAGAPVTYVEADATLRSPEGPFDLVVFCYLQLPADLMARALDLAVAELAEGGTLVVIGHDRRNLADGVGGPKPARGAARPRRGGGDGSPPRRRAGNHRRAPRRGRGAPGARHARPAPPGVTGAAGQARPA